MGDTASTKVDGEQWFLYKDGDGAVLLSPNGKAIAGNDVHVMKEADRLLHGWTGILAGELYATVGAGRPRVFDLHSALGGGASAQVDRLRFAVFDILRDGDVDCQSLPFDYRAKRIRELLAGPSCSSGGLHEVDGPDGVERFFETGSAGEEGLSFAASMGAFSKSSPR